MRTCEMLKLCYETQYLACYVFQHEVKRMLLLCRRKIQRNEMEEDNKALLSSFLFERTTRETEREGEGKEEEREGGEWLRVGAVPSSRFV